MPIGILRFIVVATGAFFYWAINGFSGKFDDEMSGVRESSTKSIRNLITGTVILTIVGILVISFFSEYLDI